MKPIMTARRHAARLFGWLHGYNTLTTFWAKIWPPNVYAHAQSLERMILDQQREIMRLHDRILQMRRDELPPPSRQLPPRKRGSVVVGLFGQEPLNGQHHGL